jgi:hypothetical protein
MATRSRIRKTVSLSTHRLKFIIPADSRCCIIYPLTSERKALEITRAVLRPVAWRSWSAGHKRQWRQLAKFST